MEKLKYRFTKDNDAELKNIANYLAGSRPQHTAANIYSDIEEMKNLMGDGICHFTFTKVNGEHRDAYGTRAADIIENCGDKAKAQSRHKATFNGTFSYFDLVRRDWRCFRVNTFVELDRDYVV